MINLTDKHCNSSHYYYHNHHYNHHYNGYQVTNLRWTGHVARIGRGEVHTGLYWGNLSEETT